MTKDPTFGKRVSPSTKILRLPASTDFSSLSAALFKAAVASELMSFIFAEVRLVSFLRSENSTEKQTKSEMVLNNSLSIQFPPRGNFFTYSDSRIPGWQAFAVYKVLNR